MKEINHTEGNDATLRAVLKRQGELFPVELSEEVMAEVVSRIGKRTTCSCAVSDVGTVLIDISGELPSGGYVIAVYGKLDGMRWRSACRGLHITKVTMPGVGNGIATDSDAYDIEMEVEMYKQPSSEAAIQRHNEDREAHADIRNLIPDNAVTDPFYVHTDNNYSDEDKEKLAGLSNYDDGEVRQMIADTNAHFADYYTKDESYPGTTVDELLEGKQDTISDLAAIRSGARAGASAYQLPSGGIPIDDLTKEAQNIIAGKVDKEVGKGLSSNDYTDADKTKLSGLSNYDDSEVRQMISDTDARFADYYTKDESYPAADLDLMFKEKQNKVTGKGLSTNDYTTADKSKLAGISAGAQVNVIESIRVNGTAAVVTNKAASVTLPNATTSTAGLMSGEDKTKLAGLVGLPECEGVTAANFFGYGGDWDATFCSLRVRWNHDYELDMEDIMLGIDDEVQNGFELGLFTDDSSVIASHRNELKVSFDLPLSTDAYAEDFAAMSVKICDYNGVEIGRLLMSDELKVKPGYHYTLLLSVENGRIILDHKRYKLPE